LEWAALGGQLETVWWLLDHGWNKPSSPSVGAALIIATAIDNYEIAEQLLIHGANPNALSEDYLISALTAAARKNPRIVDLLLKFKADIDFPLPNGDTPLSRSVYRNEYAASVILLKRGANPNASVYTTVLSTFLSSKTGAADTQSREGSPPLFWAFTHGNSRLVSELMAHGADPNACNEKGSTALHFAAREGCLDEILSLLSLGALVNCTNDDGYSPIHYATFGGWPEAAKTLLAHGAKGSDFADARDIFNQGNLPQVAEDSRTWMWEGQDLISRRSGRRVDSVIDIGKYTDLPRTGSFFDSAVSRPQRSRPRPGNATGLTEVENLSMLFINM
jgi:ankyrin repeat protein